MNNEQSKCCKKCDSRTPTSYCENGKCPCHLPPHQEPVATQKEDIEDLRLKCPVHKGIMANYSYKCICDLSLPTQQPMEWGELDKILSEIYDGGNWNAPVIRLKEIISSQIKQAEERHNQDCTREECPHGNTAYCGDGCHCDKHCKLPCKWCEREGRQKAPNNEYLEEWARASEREKVYKMIEKAMSGKMEIKKSDFGDIINYLTSN